MPCVDRMYLGSLNRYTYNENLAYNKALEFFDEKTTNVEEFDYPDYAGLPEDIYKYLSPDHVDNIQYNWILIKYGNFIVNMDSVL